MTKFHLQNQQTDRSDVKCNKNGDSKMTQHFGARLNVGKEFFILRGEELKFCFKYINF